MGCRPESKFIWDDDGIVQQECREGPGTQEARSWKDRTCVLIHAAGYALTAFMPGTQTTRIGPNIRDRVARANLSIIGPKSAISGALCRSCPLSLPFPRNRRRCLLHSRI